MRHLLGNPLRADRLHRSSSNEDAGIPILARPLVVNLTQDNPVHFANRIDRERPRFRDPSFDPTDGGIMVQGFVKFAQLLCGGWRDPFVNQELGLPERQRIALDRGAAVGQLDPQLVIQALARGCRQLEGSNTRRLGREPFHEGIKVTGNREPHRSKRYTLGHVPQNVA